MDLFVIIGEALGEIPARYGIGAVVGFCAMAFGLVLIKRPAPRLSVVFTLAGSLGIWLSIGGIFNPEVSFWQLFDARLFMSLPSDVLTLVLMVTVLPSLFTLFFSALFGAPRMPEDEPVPAQPVASTPVPVSVPPKPGRRWTTNSSSVPVGRSSATNPKGVYGAYAAGESGEKTGAFIRGEGGVLTAGRR